MEETLRNTPRIIRRITKAREPVPYPTPPYVESVPEVVIRNVRPEGNEQLKFVILSTDGRESIDFQHNSLK